MRGHLQQRGADSWRLKVFLGRSADGKKRYLERTVRGTRREADQELARMVVEAGEGRWVPSAPMTMAELLDRWLRLVGDIVAVAGSGQAKLALVILAAHEEASIVEHERRVAPATRDLHDLAFQQRRQQVRRL